MFPKFSLSHTPLLSHVTYKSYFLHPVDLIFYMLSEPGWIPETNCLFILQKGYSLVLLGGWIFLLIATAYLLTTFPYFFC